MMKMYRKHREGCPGRKYGKATGGLKKAGRGGGSRGFDCGSCPWWVDGIGPDLLREHHSLGTNERNVAQAKLDQLNARPSWQSGGRDALGNIALVRPAAPRPVPLAPPSAVVVPTTVAAAPGTVTLSTAIEKFLARDRKTREHSTPEGMAHSLVASRTTLTHFSKHVGPRFLISQVTEETIRGYRTARLLQVAASTVNKELIHIRTLMLWWEKKNGGQKLDADAFAAEPIPREKRSSKKGFEPEEEARLLAAVKDDPVMLAFITLGLRTGQGISDLAFITREETKTGRWLSARTKTGKPISIKLLPDVVAALKALPATNTGYYFWDEILQRDSLTERLRKAFKAACKRAGVRGTPHKLRHSLAARLRANKVPIQMQASILANDPLTLQEYYSHELQADRDQRDEVLASLFNAAPATPAE
jgi:integrase